VDTPAPWIDIPNGYYAVPDPRDPDTLTMWRVIDDHIEATPANARYGPVLYRRDIPTGLTKPEQGRWTAEWFETVQRPWHRAIRAAITADLEAAGALYAKTAVRCRDCGRALKDATSKAAGRGPDCRAQLANVVRLATTPRTAETLATDTTAAVR